MKKYLILFILPFLLGCSKGQNKTPGENTASIIADQSYKDDLIRVAKRLYDRELTSGTGGDISVRVPGTDRIIIKATKTCFGDLDYGKLSTLNLEGEVVEGNPSPSDEAEIHVRVYSLREDVGAIMHMHSPYATAWATVGGKIPAVTQQSVKPLTAVALVPYYRVGSPELVGAVVESYRNPGTTVVMMENHGTFVVGADLYDVLYQAEVVENTARIAYLCKALGEPVKFEF
ncbi:MAG TPA: class II aldolase/adducin family protein [archaeon]|nr:class II aldolase/adducin family protein [archaeon]